MANFLQNIIMYKVKKERKTALYNMDLDTLKFSKKWSAE